MSIDRVLDNLELNKPITCPDTGAWFITGIAARVGVQDYQQEFGMHIYRDETLIQAMVDALRMKPLTLGHFEQSPTMNRDKAAGLIVDSVYKEGLAVVRIRIDHPELCQLLDDNLSSHHLGLSVGYRTLIDKKAGTWIDSLGIAGTKGKQFKYQAQQILPVKVNHLAVVPMGRGGEIVKLITDEAPSTEESFVFSDSISLCADNVEESTVGTVPSTNSDNKPNIVEDGGALYPYPGTSTSKRKTMADNKDKYEDMYEDMKSIMDKMSKMCDAYTDAQDKMTKACDTMSSYADNLTASLNYLQAIKQAFEEQDRNAGSGEVAVPTQNMIADSASKEFSDEVREAVSLWLEFSDELKAEVKDFAVGAATLRKILLSSAGVEVTDEMSDAEVNAAFSVFKTLKGQITTAKDSGKQSDVERLFQTVSDAAPSGEPTEGYTRRANGSLVFD